MCTPLVGRLAVALTVLLATGTSPAHAATIDDAMAALADGKPGTALRVLRSLAADDPAAACLAGEVALVVDDPQQALTILEDVPQDADCWSRAAFLAAEAELALGRNDAAAARVAEAGATLLGDGRHSATAQRLEGWADRLLDQKNPQPYPAHQMLALALELDLPPDQRTALARRVAALPNLGHAAVMALSAAIAANPDDHDLRRELAPLLDPAAGLALLDDLPDDPATLATRARVGETIDLHTGWLVGQSLLATHPQSPEAGELSLRQGLAMAAEYRVVEAEALLAPIAAGDDADAAQAAWTLARLAAHGDAADATSRIEEVLTRFPGAPFRKEAEALLDGVHTRRAWAALAQGTFDEEAWAARLEAAPDSRHLALEHAFAMADSGNTAGALEHFELVTARWPESSEAEAAAEARMQLDPDPEAGWGWLVATAPDVTAAEWARAAAEQPSIRVATAGRQADDPVIDVATRALDEVEVRVHRIDLDGYIAAGGQSAEGIADLDVAIIAPDRTWTAEVPDPQPGRWTHFELPIDVDKPGAYAVTVATHDREARTTLLVSDLELVARARGADLVVAAYRNGRPAGGVSLDIASTEGIEEARTGADGLAQMRVPGGSLSVLGQSAGGPALLHMDRDSGEVADDRTRIGLDLDRAIYRPADTVNFRIVGVKGGEPAKGAWRIELEHDGVVHQVVRAQADRLGAVTGSVVLPMNTPGHNKAGPSSTTYTLLGTPPWQDRPEHLGSIRVASDSPAGHRLVTEEGAGAVIARLTDERGVPVEGTPIRWVDEVLGTDTIARTDATGTVSLPAPPRGVPFQPTATVPGTPLRETASIPLSLDAGFELDVTRIDEGLDPRVSLSGTPGPVQVRLARLVDGPPVPEAPALSVTLPLPGRAVHEPVPARSAPLRHTVWTADLSLEDGPTEVGLPEVEGGRYELVVVAPDARTHAASVEITLGQAPELDGAFPPPSGSTRLTGHGAPSLVTVEDGGRIVDAAMIRPDRSEAVEVDSAFHGEVQIVGVSTADVSSRTERVDASLDVQLDVTTDGGAWTVHAEVRDPSGRPIQAQVLFRGVPLTVEGQVGRATAIHPSVFLDRQWFPGMTAWATTLVDGGEDQPVSAALLAEQSRRQESRRASGAATGNLANGPLLQMMEGEVPLAQSSMSVSGMGFGGGGFGSAGSGDIGHRNTRYIPTQTSPTLHGWRGPVPWEIHDTNAQGVVQATLVAPPDRGPWAIEAVAIAPGTAGTARADVPTDATPFVVHDTVGPSWPDDIARPRAWIVNPGDEPATLEVDAGDGPAAVTVAPGAAWTTSLGSVPAGSEATLVVDGSPATVTVPLRDGMPDAEGPVWSIATGGGGTPLAALALQGDPLAENDAGHAAVLGRSAMAAWPHLQGDEARRAEAIVRAAVGAVRNNRRNLDVRAGSQALLLLAEARQLAEIPTKALDDFANNQLAEPKTAIERLERAWAMAVAFNTIDEATLGRLQRDAESLPPPVQALLARLEHHLGRAVTVRLDEDAGPHGALAPTQARPTDPKTLLTAGPPRAGDPTRAAYVAALAPHLTRSPGPVLVGGATVSADPDGWVRTTAEDVTIPPGALAYRSTPPVGSASAIRGGRYPVSADGLPTRSARSDGTYECAGQTPCRVRTDEAVELNLSEALYLAGGGVRAIRNSTTDSNLLQARVPGTWHLHGARNSSGAYRPPIVVEVDVEDLTPFGQAKTLAVVQAQLALPAAERETGSEGPAAALSRWPALDDWKPGLRREAAQARFTTALGGEDDPILVAAFEDLRDELPNAAIGIEDIATTAEAYQAIGKPERAVQLWRAAVGAAFLTDASVATRVTPHVGELGSIQVLRGIASRYPPVDVVQDAMFALPDRLLDMTEAIPHQVAQAGVTSTDLQLMAAAWDRDFVTLSPRHASTPEAGLRLATTLYQLDATERAAGWTQRMTSLHPDSALVDRWMLLQALALTDSGKTTVATSLLTRLATEEFPTEDGSRGFSALRPDARYALGRLFEGRGNEESAAKWYEESGLPEAELPLHALTHSQLRIVEPMVTVPPGKAASLEVELANVDEVQLRAVRVDLRALFLRDSGLPPLDAIQIDGLRPTWSGTRRGSDAAFPAIVTLDLPLSEPGAYLIRAEGPDVSGSALVIRSSLSIDAMDHGRQRRLTVMRGDRPAAGVSIRALGGHSGVLATETDVRGTATVGAGAGALAFDGSHYALAWTIDGGRQQASQSAPMPDVLQQRLKERDSTRRANNRSNYGYIGEEASDSVEMKKL